MHDFGMLFLVLKMLWLRICSLCYNIVQAHCDWDESKILNVKVVIKNCNECNDWGEKKTVRL